MIDEINADSTTDSEVKKIKEYEKTSLNSSVQLFRKFLAHLETNRKLNKIAESGNFFLLFCKDDWTSRVSYLTAFVFLVSDVKMEFWSSTASSSFPSRMLTCIKCFLSKYFPIINTANLVLQFGALDLNFLYYIDSHRFL